MFLINSQNLRHLLILVNSFWILGLYILAPYFFELEIGPSNQLMINLAAISIIPWLIIPFILPKIKVNVPRIKVPNFHYAFHLELIVWLLTFVSLLVLTFTSGNLPILTALRGAKWEEILAHRLNFDLNKSGWISLFIYLNIIISSTLLPFFITKSFVLNEKYKWTKLITASLVLVAGLNKLSFLKVVIPVFILSFVKKDLLLFLKSTSFILLFFLFINFLGKAGVNSLLQKPAATIQTNSIDISPPPPATGDGISSFILYRAFKVPYQTAETWIDFYYKNNLSAKQPIITNKTLSLLLGIPVTPLEQDIINYQFNADTTKFNGYANTTYFIDAWVKFGNLGFAIVIILIPLFIGIQVYIIDEKYLGLLVFSFFFLTSNSSISYLLSSGVLLFIFSVIMSKKNSLPESPTEPQPHS